MMPSTLGAVSAAEAIPGPDEVEVIVLTQQEWDDAVTNSLAELGLTYEELEAQAAAGDFVSWRARKLWLAIKPCPGDCGCRRQA